ncbi:hypothetical protein AA309_02455 [Microvirga vignae]|uniref:Uncharacterized protein n=1 Tax=Microvirga vignae TaxID=1225564 RepID=A0A0H1RIH8_9HYPH|nr:hypothetical protein [Microvirga vignae]KLK94661.1 hypothetical protein AA309_02455 [Microvirga vignae]
MMIDDEVEAVARAIARARHPASPENPTPVPETVSEHHRDLARLTIATLARHRAAKAESSDKLGPGEMEHPAADRHDMD